jgi:hypothetical protein
MACSLDSNWMLVTRFKWMLVTRFKLDVGQSIIERLDDYD